MPVFKIEDDDLRMDPSFICSLSQQIIKRLYVVSGGSVIKNPPANAGDTRDTGLIPGWGISPGGGKGNILAWRIPWTEESDELQSTRVAKGRTGLSMQARG